MNTQGTLRLLRAIFLRHRCWLCGVQIPHTKAGHQSLCHPCARARRSKPTTSRRRIPTTRASPNNATGDPKGPKGPI